MCRIVQSRSRKEITGARQDEQGGDLGLEKATGASGEHTRHVACTPTNFGVADISAVLQRIESR